MPTYRVVWEIDIDDEATPQAAAAQAWQHMRRPDSTANVFDVIAANGEATRVDLLDLDEEEASAAAS